MIVFMVIKLLYIYTHRHEGSIIRDPGIYFIKGLWYDICSHHLLVRVFFAYLLSFVGWSVGETLGRIASCSPPISLPDVTGDFLHHQEMAEFWGFLGDDIQSWPP